MRDPSPGIRMKVLRKSGGPLSDGMEDEAITEGDQDEFQHLILVPSNPFHERCNLLLRVVFFLLLGICVITATILYINGNNQAQMVFRPPKHSVLSLQANKSLEDLPSRFGADVCLIDDKWKFDCFPAKGATVEECLTRGCCWKPLESHDIPWCYYPVGFSYYSLGNFTQSAGGFKGSATSVRKSPYPDDVKELQFDVIFETENIIRIKITDSARKRYEVPLDYRRFENKPENRNYTFKSYQNGFQLFRLGEVTPIFDTTVAPIVYADQFLQISTSLLTEYVYGIGESVDSLRKNISWSRYVLYNHDTIPKVNVNNYGSHPMYMVMDKSGRSYGVFLANSNAMEIVLQPGPALTFRTIGGVIDLRIFLGDKPSDVIDQYTSVIGRPMIPPYWSLGFHLCRFNYGTLNHTSEILRHNLEQGIPIDVQWNDLDYMHNQNDFTYDPVKFAGLPDFITTLHERGMRYIPLIDPGISGGEGKGKYTPYDSGIDMDIFIKDANGEPFVGKVWNPNSTVWPDFSNENTTKYWLYQLESFRKAIHFDGAWIDMNEPSNFWDGSSAGCLSNSTLDNPPYVPRVNGGKLFYKTICPSARQAGGRHYDLHNLYGIQETMVTHKVLGDLTNERPFIISRSTFPGQGKYGGHWTGDVISSWDDLRKSVPQVLSFGLFGIPMVGADICGFNGNTTVDLCKRWHQLGAFYPFSRNHNTDDGIPQDPASLGPEVVAAAKETLTVRYSLLPYIYSLFFKAHLTGSPVARALFYEFPQDANTFFIDSQFMLGSSVMIVPILQENYDQPTISAYLPQGWWYSHYSNDIIDSLGEPKYLTIPQNSIPIMYKGGTVVMKQKPGRNTQESRRNAFSVHAFLSKDNVAYGEFFWDDGVSNSPHQLVHYNQYELTAKNNVLTMSKIFEGFDMANFTLGEIEVRGVLGGVNSVELNNVAFNFTFANRILRLTNLNLQGSGWTDGFYLKWSQ